MNYVCIYILPRKLITARERASMFDTCERLCSFTQVQILFPFHSFLLGSVCIILVRPHTHMISDQIDERDMFMHGSADRVRMQ